MSENVVIDKKAKRAYLPQAKAVVSFGNAVSSSTGSSDGSTQVLPRPQQNTYGTKYAFWGDNNNFPNEVIELIGKCGVAGAAILYNILATYGGGIQFGKYVFENNQKRFIPLDLTDPKYSEIYDFFLASDIQDDYLIECASDLIWFFNFFPYVILNKTRTKINKLYVAEAAYSRYKLREENSNRLTHIGVCGDWTREDQITEIPVLSDYDPVADLQSRKSGYRFAMPGYFPTPGKSYYQKTYWDSVRANGWIDNAIEVPKFMKAIFRNTTHLKWHIRIPDVHWTVKYKDWDSKPEKIQLELIETELNEMQQFLTGTDNARKIFFSHFAIDKITNKEVPGWSIEPIQDYDKEGKYLPESSAANSEILFALNTHPDLIGAGTPGGSYSSRGNSGSNTRETDLIKKSLLASFRHRILKPLYHTKRFNNWPAESQFRIDDTVLTTLDNGSQAIKAFDK